MKILIWLLFSLIFLGLALVPEFAMYLTYHAINPQTELSKIIMFAVFWLGGVGVCVAFAAGAFALWMAFTTEFFK